MFSVNSYLAGFKEIYDMAKIRFPKMLEDEIVSDKKLQACNRALSRYLYPDMCSEIIKEMIPKTLKIFSEERTYRQITEILRTDKVPVSYTCHPFTDNYVGRGRDVFLGVYSKGEPKLYIVDYQIRLIKTDTVTSNGTFYVLPFPILSENMLFTPLKCEDVVAALYISIPNPDRGQVNLSVQGFFPELSVDKNILFVLFHGVINFRILTDGERWKLRHDRLAIESIEQNNVIHL